MLIKTTESYNDIVKEIINQLLKATKPYCKNCKNKNKEIEFYNIKTEITFCSYTCLNKYYKKLKEIKRLKKENDYLEKLLQSHIDNNWSDCRHYIKSISESIKKSKEIIKQLEEETK